MSDSTSTPPLPPRPLRRRLLRGCLFSLAAVVALAASLALMAVRRVHVEDRALSTLVFQGQPRTYLLRLPPVRDPARPMPLVLVLHGGGGHAFNAERMSSFTAKGAREGFVVVYPNGTGRLSSRLLTWNSGNCCGYARDQGADDVGFIRALVADLESKIPVDPKRVYVAGMSNGGMMTYRLACELSDVFAAAAPVAGALNVDPCEPAHPVSILAFHGTADQHVLYDGGESPARFDKLSRIDRSAADSVGFWVKHDGCAATPARSERGKIIDETWGGGFDGTEVRLVTIKDEGHTWPGGVSYPGGDTPTRAISATDQIWDFFKAHPKP